MSLRAPAPEDVGSRLRGLATTARVGTDDHRLEVAYGATSVTFSRG